ncbi:hypothetical protein LL972_08545 [Xanthomonas campestris pv. asclepiadis]|uniref:hypothetical protein n=1 Tax=Xanthomonas campestris TaxID=339 RepID=UPI001E3BAFC5|nr:hypothetical protein [Xanthomonas campestris]MCC4616051.1 hypothetical protein [Xanthomonas campestris pv. asclepiadis]
MQTLPFVNGDPPTLRAAEDHAVQAHCPHCGASRAGDVAAPAAAPRTGQLPDTTAVASAQTATHQQRAVEPAHAIAPLQCPILRAALLGSIALVLLVVDMFVLWPLP